MIVSDYHLSKARENLFAIPKSRAIDLDQEPPAQVRILVSLVGNSKADTSSEVNVLLFIKNYARDKSAETAEMMGRLPFNVDTTPAEYTEVHRARVEPGTDVTQLQYGLFALAKYDLRIEFYERDTSNGDFYPICYTDFTLEDILSAKDEKFETLVYDIDSKLPESGKANLSVVWMREWGTRLIFEMKIKIDKRQGWPFGTTRPFFVVYVYSGRSRVWTPVYRSEVLTQASDHPKAQGSMYFQLAELKTQLPGESSQAYFEDTHPIRIEFFHYKTQGSSKMIAYMVTSNMKLRQARLNEKLDMEVNTFAQGELVGSVVLRDRKIRANACFFSFWMEFGGDVAGYCLYLNVSLQSLKENRFSSFSSRTPSKPFYRLKRYDGNESWTSVYRSEVPPKGFGNIFQFKLTRISLKKLNANDMSRPTAIAFYRDSFRQNNPEIGVVKTTEEDLRAMPLHAVLPIRSEDDSYQGYARLEQKETNDTRLFLSLVCFLGGQEQECWVNPTHSLETNGPEQGG